MPKNIIAIIPSRYASSRFPGKPLVQIGGKSMIQRVYEQVTKVKIIDKVLVATDDERIATHLRDLNIPYMMTSAAHISGTDRLGEVAKVYSDFEYYINIQGDEPFIEPAQITSLVETITQGQASLATLAHRIKNPRDIFNHNVVKVVFDKQGSALYFSRQAIPFLRGTPKENWLNTQAYYKHIGLYAFTKNALERVAQLEPSTLEVAESLEQLRWLDNGMKIQVGITSFESFGIDTPEDLDRLERMKNMW